LYLKKRNSIKIKGLETTVSNHVLAGSFGPCRGGGFGADLGREHLCRVDRTVCEHEHSAGDETMTMVIIINDRREVSAPLDRVWDIVANVDNNPVHWPNLRTVDNISKDGIVVEREEKLR